MLQGQRIMITGATGQVARPIRNDVETFPFERVEEACEKLSRGELRGRGVIQVVTDRDRYPEGERCSIGTNYGA